MNPPTAIGQVFGQTGAGLLATSRLLPGLDLDPALWAVVAAVSAGLILFSMRRLVLLLADAPARSEAEELSETGLPRVTLIVPAHDEADAVHALCAALSRLRYPAKRLAIVLVSDGSTDGTAERFSEWTRRRPNACTVVLTRRVGKARALNGVIARVQTEVVVVLDADLRPHPDFVRRIVAPLREPGVGGVAGLIQPENPAASTVTRYAAVESWVHQLVTSAGKDRLGLNPPTLGASAYRLEALLGVGSFPVVPQGEDVALTVALTRAGWTTRFVPDAVAENGLVRTLPEYWRQHVRWSRGSFAAVARSRQRNGTDRGREATAPPRPSPARRIARALESHALAASYLDRLVLVPALALSAAGWLPLWLPLIHLTLPAVSAYVALRKAGVSRRSRYLLALVAMFPVDTIASAAAAIAHVSQRPTRWRSPARRLTSTHGRLPGRDR